jgi:hypothetical protein
VRIPTAIRIIPTPPVISKYFRNNIAGLLLESIPLPVSHAHRLPGKEQAEHFAENELLDQQRDG